MITQNLSGFDLVKKIGEDDTKAFEELYSRYWEDLFLFSLSKLKSKDEAKDVVQNVFIKFWDKRKHIVIRQSIDAYLFTITKYEILDRMAENLMREHKQQYYSKYILPEFTELFDPVQLQELTAAIEKSIDSLPDRLREIYQLSKQEDLSIKEIASRLNISEQTVKNQLSIASKRLKLSLKPVMMAIILSGIHHFKY